MLDNGPPTRDENRVFTAEPFGVPACAVLRVVVLAAALFLTGAAAAFALTDRGGAKPKPAPVVVHVTMRDFRFVLSRQRVPAGTVRFVVVNRGATVHDFADRPREDADSSSRGSSRRSSCASRRRPGRPTAARSRAMRRWG